MTRALKRLAVGRADAAVAGFMLATLALLLLPMPTWVVDLGVAGNLSVSLVLLGSALYVPEPLRFSSFPALLLLSTLFRLALNVCSTRLILLQADAGRVIDAFGQAVVRGDYAVGALVFAMLTAVQFVVVARGAERIAEVSARFSLDALPGRQLAIEAELRGGLLGAAEVRRARAALSRESELLGALDGAMKFVKGDAIAGLVIAAINAFGGVGLGVLKRGLDLSLSAQRYGLLAIGDALSSQLPSLLSAAAAGILVTRMASRDRERSLAQTIVAESLGDPRVLAVAAAVLLVLASAPGLPALPFSLLGLALLGLALRALRRHGEGQAPAEAVTLRRAPGPHADEPALAATYAALGAQLGLTLPPLRVHDDPGLPPGAVTVLWCGRPPGLAVDSHAMTDAAHALTRAVRAEAPSLVTLDHVGGALDALSEHAPRLVRELVPGRITLPELSQLLGALVDEGLSFALLPRVLDALGRNAPNDAPGRLAHVRRALAAELCAGWLRAGSLRAARLSPELEEAIADALRGEPSGRYLALAPDLARDIVSSVRDALDTPAAGAAPVALLTSAEIRPHVRALLRSTCPDLAVVCADELLPSLLLAPGPVIGP